MLPIKDNPLESKLNAIHLKSKKRTGIWKKDLMAKQAKKFFEYGVVVFLIFFRKRSYFYLFEYYEYLHAALNKKKFM